MRPDLILTDATIVDSSGLRQEVDIVVHGGIVASVEPAGTVERAGAPIVDCASRVVVPGYANVHHHLYSGLLRGAPTSVPTRNQKERLTQVIWPFERRLTHEDVRLAAELGLLEAIAAGTTTVIDHHASGGCIPGVLDVIAETVRIAGVRAVLCYEITDRDGQRVATAGLAETERFLKTVDRASGLVRGMVGLHAMSTVGPDTLDRAAALAERFGAGIHLHVGESEHDNEESVAQFGARPVARLAARRALSPRTLIAHAIHVTDDEVAALADQDVLLAHNPRSNASNGVGVADLERLRRAGLTAGVGGDGFTQDIRNEFSLIPLLQRQHWHDPTRMSDGETIRVGVQGAATILERLGGWRVGRIAAGFDADLVVLDYDPAAPLVASNAAWHYARGFPGASVREVWVGGRCLLRDGSFQTLDAERIRHEQARRFNSLGSRLHAN